MGEIHTVEEAAAQLDEAVRAVRQLPWGESPPGTEKVLARYEAKKRALALATLDTVLERWGGRLSRGDAAELMKFRAELKTLGS